jgi:hypothetical protein
VAAQPITARTITAIEIAMADGLAEMTGPRDSRDLLLAIRRTMRAFPRATRTVWSRWVVRSVRARRSARQTHDASECRKRRPDNEQRQHRSRHPRIRRAAVRLNICRGACFREKSTTIRYPSSLVPDLPHVFEAQRGGGIDVCCVANRIGKKAIRGHEKFMRASSPNAAPPSSESRDGCAFLDHARDRSPAVDE